MIGGWCALGRRMGSQAKKGRSLYELEKTKKWIVPPSIQKENNLVNPVRFLISRILRCFTLWNYVCGNLI